MLNFLIEAQHMDQELDLPQSSTTSQQFLPMLLAAFFILHVALALWMPGAHTKFMLGDRAHDRLAKVQAVLNAPPDAGPLAVMAAQGSPGDYMFLLPAYAAAGPDGVILQSIVLYLAALACLYWLTRDTFGPASAKAATILYALLPATIFHPHAFVSETISNPLLIIGSYALAQILRRDGNIWTWTAVAGLLIGIVTFSRHVYILLPLIAAALAWYYVSPVSRGRAVAASLIGLGYLPAILWTAIALMAPTASQSPASAGGLGANLQARAERVALIAGVPPPQAIVEQQREGLEGATMTITPKQFTAFVAAHPLAYARSIVSDAVNILGNPGMAMVAGRYLGLFDLNEKSEEDLSRWRKIRDEHDMIAVAHELWQTSASALIINAAGMVAWISVIGLALLGAIKAWRTPAIVDRPVCVMLMGLFVYVIAFNSVVAGYTRWDHRSGVEFVIAIFAAYAVASGVLSQLLEYVTRRDRSAQ